jgi:hypothetical protein
LLGGTAVLLGVRSFGHRRRSVPLSTLLVDDRIADAVKERLDVLIPPQVVDVGGHFMQAGCQLLEVDAQSRDRCAFAERRPQNPAPQRPAGRSSTVPTKDAPVNRLPHPVDRVPVLGHIRHGEPRSVPSKDHSPRIPGLMTHGRSGAARRGLVDVGGQLMELDRPLVTIGDVDVRRCGCLDRLGHILGGDRLPRPQPLQAGS